jgi:hypothetical protein
MSPILVRPVREQLEHDRIIRLLPGRYKRRFEVGINPAAEQNAAIGVGTSAVFPDAVLYSTEKARKIQGVVEVETIESINHLEAMSQWAPYSRLKVPFHLYVPIAALDVARRLAEDHQVSVSEIWSYDHVGDQVRFTLVHKIPETTVRSIAAPPVAAPKPAAAPKAAAPKTAAPKVKPAPAKKAAAPRPVRAATGRPARPAAAGRKVAAVKRARPATKPTAKRPAPPARSRAAAPARKAGGTSKRK